MKSYLFGGRLGDLLHGLVIPRFIYDRDGEKAVIYISDIGDKFTMGLENTFRDLMPIMEAQPFVESFEGFQNQPVHYPMFLFRNYPRINEDCWTDTYFQTFMPWVDPPRDYKWLDWARTRPTNESYLVVSRKFINQDSTARYRAIIKDWRGPVYFMAQNKAQYDNSLLTDCAEFIHTPELTDMFTVINGCTCFLGDQSAPMAIASALGKRRIVELNRMRSHYEMETKYTDSLTWFHYGYVPDEITR